MGGQGLRSSDFDLRPEGLLDMLCGRVTPCPDGEAAVFPQGRGHRGRIHVLWQLALVCKGVHDRAVGCQLGKGDRSEHAVPKPVPADSPLFPTRPCALRARPSWTLRHVRVHCRVRPPHRHSSTSTWRPEASGVAESLSGWQGWHVLPLAHGPHAAGRGSHSSFACSEEEQGASVTSPPIRSCLWLPRAASLSAWSQPLPGWRLQSLLGAQTQRPW